MIVEVTQFHRPNGRQTQERTELPNDCAVGYEAMRRKECRLTAEVLSSGLVSVCIEHEEGDFDIHIVENGPKVQTAIADMLRKFDGAIFDGWLEAVRKDEP